MDAEVPGRGEWMDMSRKVSSIMVRQNSGRGRGHRICGGREEESRKFLVFLQLYHPS